MNKHTPGPWIVRPDYGKENVYRLWNQDTNFHDDTSPEAMDANARLIAAVTDLLGAGLLAEECLERASNALEKLGDENTRGFVRSALIELRAAIAKATS